MNIDGEKRISICYEDNYGRVSIENYRLNEIVKYISAQSFADVQLDNDYKNKKTKYIIIDKKKYDLETNIRIELEISLLCVPLVCSGYFTQKYKAKNDIKITDFYNYIVEIVEDYAYELDTDMNNIKIEVQGLEILNIYDKEGI